ncbi:MAG: ATP-binding protein [Chloroflexota bacterium]
MKAKESVLIVDDDLGFLQVAQAILRAKGYEVATVPSAGEAISRAEERFYHVAVLDISLPDIPGTELLSRLLARHPDMLVVMLTGHSSVQNAAQSLNRGAFAYLEKPLDPETLLSVIGRGLEKQRLVFENRHLLEELEQRNRETGILLSVSRAVAQSLDLAQIIDAALGQVLPALEVAASYVYLAKDGNLVLSGGSGFSPPLLATLAGADVDRGVTGAIFREARPAVVGAVAGDTRPDLARLAEAGYRSYAGVPLVMLAESIGVMGMVSRAERDFSPREVELLAAIGREIAIAVRNAQLYEAASSARALRELDTLRTELLANVSHELRTPLAAIKGFASSLLQPDVSFDTETTHEFVTTIDKEADRLNRLIEELLVMSRLEAGTLEVTREPHRLAAVVESIEDRLHSLALKHRLRIQVPEDIPLVAIDDGRIGEVLSNLVENAAKYSPEGAPITVEARTNGGREVVVSVADQGEGIPPEYHQKIFERFCQLEGRGGQPRRGTGLGLSICHGIIAAHGGRIWVESQPGQGARFNFTLPLS